MQLTTETISSQARSLEETSTSFDSGRNGNYCIGYKAFVCRDRDVGRVITTPDDPTNRIAQGG